MNSNKMEDEEKTIAVAVLSAIIILAGLLVYMSLTPAPQEPFASLYVLDSEKKADNCPQLLVMGENNTFLLWVGVENFMGRIEYSSVLVKMDDGTGYTNPSPLDPVYRFEKVLLNKETWEFPITITINQTGQHRIIFELWLFNEFENVFSYSKNGWCNIRLDVLES
ncbi:MAG: DUF1616 domain-containing protein [Candidatus Bathyarchaeota archaeon]|nr:DUF1616 domain-containing protein [Candidatus Bathyarchaeota archaeon]